MVDGFDNEADAEAFQTVEDSIVVCVNLSAFVLGTVVFLALMEVVFSLCSSKKSGNGLLFLSLKKDAPVIKNERKKLATKLQ